MPKLYLLKKGDLYRILLKSDGKMEQCDGVLPICLSLFKELLKLALNEVASV